MALDPYALCPCGSGKKLKFCCHAIADDLVHAEELLVTDQPKLALNVLEKVAGRDPGSTWYQSIKIQSYLMLGQLEEAKPIVEAFLAAHSDDPIAVYYDTLTMLLDEGPVAAREKIDSAMGRLLQVQRTETVSMLARAVADSLSGTPHYMAERQYLIAALATCPEEQSRNQFRQQITEFDQNPNIPFPFRSSYGLKLLPANQPLEAEFNEALALGNRLQWLSAARKFEALAEKDPHQPEFSYNAGLCYAWSFDDVSAAEMLGQAADETPEFDAGVEMETLAQLMEFNFPDHPLKLDAQRYPIKSVDGLMKLMETQPRLTPHQAAKVPEGGSKPVGVFFLLDQVSTADVNTVELEQIPHTLAEFVVWNGLSDPPEPGQLVVRALSEECKPADVQGLVGAVATELESTEPIPIPGHTIPKEYGWMLWRWFLPKMSATQTARIRKMVDAHWSRLIENVWWNRALPALDAQSPSQTVGDEEMQLPLAAAVNVLEALCATFGHQLDAQPLRDRLKLAAAEPITGCDQNGIGELTALDLLRVDVTTLGQDAVPMYMLRLQVLGLTTRFRKALDWCMNSSSLQMSAKARYELQSLLIETCAQSGSTQDAIAACEQLRALDVPGLPMEARIRSDLREFSLRVSDPGDPQLKVLLSRIVNQYLPKVPTLRQPLQQLLEQAELVDTPLWSILQGTNIVTATADGQIAEEGGGLWTPSSATPGAQEGKLWLPGQA